MTLLQILIALFSISLAGLAGIMMFPTKHYRQTYCRTTMTRGNLTETF